MSTARPGTLPLVLAALVAAVVLCAMPSSARADEKPRATASNAWCGPDAETLPGDVCYIDARGKGERRTLVIWLHGVIGKNTNWSHNHQKMLQRVSKTHGVEVLFPRGLPGDGVYGWPGTIDAQEKNEQALIDEWMKAKTVLEKRDNRSFDEVFVFGFSSGAYFTSSLAMRGRVDVDGYAVFAGGQPMPAQKAAVDHFAPVYVGICGADKTTAAHSRAFVGSLAAAGIPRMASEQNVGHGLSEVHFAQALAFLRKTTKPRATS